MNQGFKYRPVMMFWPDAGTADIPDMTKMIPDIADVTRQNYQ